MKSIYLYSMILSFLISINIYSAEIKSVNFFQEGDVSKFSLDIDSDNPEVTRFHVFHSLFNVFAVELLDKWLNWPKSTTYEHKHID